IEFELRPEQLSGIELVVNGYKLAWSITEYLAVLDNSVSALLNGRAGLGTKPAPQPPNDENSAR
ncbi:hypothetical protein RZS08_60880, partial [Arthrospira platensis SPKY1]|nr:hypothetical protein [Arthrospira platensis SPKY1]